MRTVVFGGTFNPPHLGHERMVRLVGEEFRPDRLLIIPNYLPPHKELADGSPTPDQRLELCRAAFGKFGFASVCDMELRRRNVSYTIDTLTELRAQNPWDDLHLLIGSDSLLGFTSWRRFSEILQIAGLLVLSREREDLALLRRTAEVYRREYGARIRILQQEPFVLSSSEIRGGAIGEDTLSRPVLDYIEREHLYGR